MRFLSRSDGSSGGGSHHDKGPNFFPVTSYNSGYGALTDEDTAVSILSP